ncbi:MAG: hypothetical protein KatS3mg014_1649 [Actinomycetota bacterium]|nr:MAG: hypothetical protein KatS3mg014_1649 [Actinomycetota bacterium]
MRREGIARLRAEDGFTLAELLVGVVVVGLIMGSIAAALIVGLRTTDETTDRLNESHDVQISSAYLANDVQSAASVQVAGGGTCSSATTIVTFTYADGRVATYACGPSGSETRVTRTFDGVTEVLAHFAGTAKPSVTCSPSCGSGTPARVDITFTERSGLTFTLTGSRRTHGSEGVSTAPREATFIAFGSSPLHIKGGCKKNDPNETPEDQINCTQQDFGGARSERPGEAHGHRQPLRERGGQRGGEAHGQSEPARDRRAQDPLARHVFGMHP